MERLVFEYSKLRNNSIEKILLYYIPNIIITWRQSSIWYSVSNHLRSILFTIQSSRSLSLKLNKDSKLSDWKRGYVLLENLDYFRTLTSDANILTQITLLSEIVTKNNIKKLKKELTSIRKIEKFRIAYLHSVRDALFHEGSAYSEDKLSQCNVIMKKILDNLIGALISEIFTSFKKIIRHLNRPYLP